MSKNSQSRSTPRSIKKPRGSFHPDEVTDITPHYDILPDGIGDEEQYGNLTDETPYRYYAWEFLRRNRFFQLAQDAREGRKIPTFSEEERAFENKNGEVTWGLTKEIHYKENYILADRDDVREKKRVMVQWEVIGLFQRSKYSKRAINHIKLASDEVAIVFDFEPLRGGIQAIDIQIEIARAELYRLAKVDHYSSPKAKCPNKKVLRNLLRVIDLFSENRYSLEKVTEKFFAFKKPTPRPISIAVMGEADKEKAKKAEKANKDRVSELSIDAFKYVYEGEYLTLLFFDAWPWKDE